MFISRMIGHTEQYIHHHIHSISLTVRTLVSTRKSYTCTLVLFWKHNHGNYMNQDSRDLCSLFISMVHFDGQSCLTLQIDVAKSESPLKGIKRRHTMNDILLCLNQLFGHFFSMQAFIEQNIEQKESHHYNSPLQQSFTTVVQKSRRQKAFFVQRQQQQKITASEKR